MFTINSDAMSAEVKAIAKRFGALPKHIAKKHLVASMRRAINKAKGVPTLRRLTPPLNTRRGRRAKGEKRTTGALRRAVTVKAKWIGNNKSGAAVAGLGYRYGAESKKAIFLEFGTPTIQPRRMVEKAYAVIRTPVAKSLAGEMAQALERAARELASGKNPGYGG